MIRLERPANLLIAALLCGLAGAGCPKKDQPTPAPSPPVPEPAPRPGPVEPAPQPVEAPAVKPAETPASKPVAVATRPVASQPVSTYDSTPPYPVKLYVHSPEDKQPGWLKILKLANDKQVATAGGLFPEQNEIKIETENVQQIQIHIGHLPLAPRKRTFLRIDGQNIEIATKDREFLIMERSPAGIWSAQPRKK